MAKLNRNLTKHEAYYPFSFDLKVNDGPFAGQEGDVLVNGDGSVTVNNWPLLEWWKDNQMTPDAQEFAMLTLLFAARGNIREVSKEEAHAIAKRVCDEARAKAD